MGDVHALRPWTAEFSIKGLMKWQNLYTDETMRVLRPGIPDRWSQEPPRLFGRFMMFFQNVFCGFSQLVGWLG